MGPPSEKEELKRPPTVRNTSQTRPITRRNARAGTSRTGRLRIQTRGDPAINATPRWNTLRDHQDWQQLRQRLERAQGMLLFKFSPRCPVSLGAEIRVKTWLDRVQQDSGWLVGRIDVVRDRPLSQTLSEELGIDHASPQVIALGPDGQVLGHASHARITDSLLNGYLGLDRAELA